MLELFKSVPDYNETQIMELWDKEDDQVFVFQRKDLIFVFNFNGQKSFTDYGILADAGSYKVVLNTDNKKYDGYGLIDENVIHYTISANDGTFGKEWLKLYIPARSAFVLKKQ